MCKFKIFKMGNSITCSKICKYKGPQNDIPLKLGLLQVLYMTVNNHHEGVKLLLFYYHYHHKLSDW